jgi:hypothetical protein
VGVLRAVRLIVRWIRTVGLVPQQPTSQTSEVSADEMAHQAASMGHTSVFRDCVVRDSGWLTHDAQARLGDIRHKQAIIGGFQWAAKHLKKLFLRQIPEQSQ